ncbi:DUF4232 domain-containing protein [Streptomyces sp. NPDC058284]|uniref:DUF4232 domain-containing protein n=1 Tax=unclassified Streptomyces TaxID=2593676 RepID=UPI003651D1CC
MKHAHATKTLLAGLALISTLGLTACNGDDGSTDAAPAGSSSGQANGGGSSSDGSSGSTEDSTGNGGSGSGGSTGGKGSDTGTGDGQGTAAGAGSNNGGKVGMCRSDELEVTATDNSTDKTEGVVTVQFKNGGGRDCSINGYAGVDLKAATGDTVSVDRNGEQARPSVLKDGESAAFNITFAINNTGGSGVRIAKILVTPPNETKTVTIAWPAGTLPVSEDGGGTELAIGPVVKASDSPAG